MTIEELENIRNCNSSYFDSLRKVEETGIMTTDKVQAKYNMKKKEIIKEHEKIRKIWQGTGKDTRWFTRLPDGSNNGKGKKIAKTNRADLEKAIVEFYQNQPDKTMTIRKLYPQFIEQKRLEKARDTTVRRYENTWDKYLESDTVLVDADITKITRSQYREWMLRFLDANPMTYKCYSGVKSVLMMIIDLAADKDLLPDNNFRSVKFSKNCFLEEQEKTEDEVFTKEETQKVVSYLWNWHESKPSYTVPLAALFQFQTGLRVGELEAIRFSDVDSDGFLHVKRQLVKVENEEGKLSQVQFVEHAKSNSRKKPIYLTEEARMILELVRQTNIANGDTAEDYVFYNSRHKPMTTATVNRCLITACEKTGTPVRRSHKVRKTFGTILADAGVNLTMLTSAMGHATPDVTFRHYIKDRNTKAETAEIIENVLRNESVTPCDTFSTNEKAPILQ
ncbi:MAG: tyrosine-type recombinase/integrase [Clostridiales bacterium]|nr:tyrosine-type recombinase/integrase [Clostridiales bacterium]